MITASGVRRSCDTADSSELRSSSVRAHGRLARLAGQPRAADREAGAAGQRVDQPPLLGVEAAGAARAGDHQHAERLIARRERDRGDRGARQGRRAVAGRLAVLEAPGRHRRLLRRQRHEAGHRDQPLLALGDQHRGGDAHHLLDVADRGGGDVGDLGRGGDVAGEGEQGRGPPLAVVRLALLRAQPGRQRADREAGAEHHGEGEQVARVRHREGEARRHEADVEGDHRQRRRQQRRPAPAERGDHDRDQVEHRQVGGAERAEQQEPEHGDEGDAGRRAHVRARARRGHGGARQLRRRGAAAALERRDHVELDLAGAADELIEQAAAQEVAPAAVGRLAGEDARDVLLARVLEQDVGDRLAAQADDVGAERLGEPQVGLDPLAVALAERAGRHVDERDLPVGVEPLGDPLAGADQPLGAGAGAGADQQALARRPRPLDAALPAVSLDVDVDPLGGAAERQLAERGEVALLEEVLGGPRGLLAEVDLALGEPLEQRLGGEVDERELVGAGEQVVGHRLAHLDAGDLLDDVAEALDVLDVERRVDVDAGVEQIDDVLPPLEVAAAGRVGVGQLVDEDQRRLAGERRLEVELVELDAAVGERAARQHLEPLEQGLRLAAAVGLDDADHDVDAVGLQPPRGLEHRVRLADPGRRAEEDLEVRARPLLRLHALEQRVGIRPLVIVPVHLAIVPQAARAGRSARRRDAGGPRAVQAPDQAPQLDAEREEAQPHQHGRQRRLCAPGAALDELGHHPDRADDDEQDGDRDAFEHGRPRLQT
ncbi:MAG TPA: hypothetical protein VHE35_06055 [Kofleriaceae bacterium]|nr:hypothetical protein [Kofleriaceae bacterium]